MQKGLCIGLAILSMVVITVRPTTAAVISFTGSGGAVPDGSATGATFDIPISDPRLIAASGNNVTLTLIGVDTTQTAGGRFTLWGAGRLYGDAGARGFWSAAVRV